MSLALSPARDAGMLTVMAAGEVLALRAAEVAEVGRVPPCTRIPNAPASVCGVAHWRGRVVPVLSLAVLMGSAAAREGAGRLLVLAGDAPIGLVVDVVAALAAGSEASPLDVRALLDRDLASLQRYAAARVPALPAETAAAPAAAEDLLTLVGLQLGGQEYGWPLDQVDRVMRPPPSVTQLPRTDEAMLGTIAVESGLLPIVSLAVLLGLAQPRIAASARILVTTVAGARVGLMVETVTGTLTVARSRIDAVPPLLIRGAAEAQITGICRLEEGRRLVSLLGPEHLLDAQTAARIRSRGQQEQPGMTVSEASALAQESFVIFRLGAEEYGLPIAAVHEVARHPDSLARVPDAPDFVAGIMSLRGRAVPVIDMARRFGAARGQGRGRRVIVVSVGGVTAGLAVDAVSDVLSFPAEALQPLPEFEAGTEAFDRIAVRSADRMILLISPRGVIAAAERDLLAALAQAT